jgi:hypothetical protein
LCHLDLAHTAKVALMTHSWGQQQQQQLLLQQKQHQQQRQKQQ